MEFDLKYTIFIYIILMILVFLWKPQIFDLNNDNRKKKTLYLIFLIVIIAIISFYCKVLFESFF
jgi:tryptophan-rich sensory protein